MKAIAYSLFGYDRDQVENCFDFNTYLRGLMLCLRFNRLIYPDWQTILETDHVTYDAFADLFKPLESTGTLLVEKNRNGAMLCQAMLWRLQPAYMGGVSHLLCRDLDSLSTYREAQAVQVWMNHNKAMHAITDSVSHDVPLLGGMIGIIPEYFSERTKTHNYEELMAMCVFDLSYKGSDQVFLNQTIYPFFANQGNDSITQHYFKGYGNTWLSDFHRCNCWLEAVAIGHTDNCPENISLAIPMELKENNNCCQHIGSAGWNEPTTIKFIHKHRERFTDLIEAEKKYPKIFTWNE